MLRIIYNSLSPSLAFSTETYRQLNFICEIWSMHTNFKNTHTHTSSLQHQKQTNDSKLIKKRQQNQIKYKTIGKSHLAAVRICGNKAYNTRRATTPFDDDKVRNDVNLLSFYLKNRQAAAEHKEPAVILESCRYYD